MYFFRNNNPNSQTKGFTEVQKGKLMGWCGFMAWKDMPQIWKDIKKAKSNEDLRVILAQYWDKHQGNLNVQYYSIYWIEEILTAMKKVIFTKSDRATYKMSESFLSPLLLMPLTEGAQLEIKNKYQR